MDAVADATARVALLATVHDLARVLSRDLLRAFILADGPVVVYGTRNPAPERGH